MGIRDFIILGLVAVLCLAAAVKLKRRRGSCAGCGGNCAGCGGNCAGCGGNCAGCGGNRRKK